MAKFFFAFLRTETKSRSINAKKEQGNYPAILTEQAWSIKDLLHGQKITPKNFAFAETKREIPSVQKKAHVACSGSQSEHRICFILPAHGPSHIISVLITTRTDSFCFYH